MTNPEFARWDEAVAKATRDAADRLSGLEPIKESDLEDALLPSLNASGLGPFAAVGAQKVEINSGWLPPRPGRGKGYGTPGKPDIICNPDEPAGEWTLLVECKWDSGLHEATWDMFKLTNLIHGGQGKRGYMVVGAAASHWRNGGMGTELFGTAVNQGSSRELVGADPQSETRRKHWIQDLSKESAGYPLMAPHSWETRHLASARVKSTSWELRAAVIEQPDDSDFESTKDWFPGEPLKHDGSGWSQM